MAEFEERVLVDRARAGDKQAFNALYHRHYPLIRGVVHQLVRDREDREDVVQVTFTRAYQALPYFRSQSQFGTWLYRIATNACHSFLRSFWQLRGTRLSDVDLDSGQVAPDVLVRSPATQEREAIAGLMAAAARAEIEALPEIYRAPAKLRFVEDLSYLEISKRLQMPLGTVKTRLHRSRNLLRNRLEGLETWN